MTDEEIQKLVESTLVEAIYPKINGLKTQDCINVTSSLALRLIGSVTCLVHKITAKEGINYYINETLDNILAIRDEIKAGEYHENFKLRDN